MNKEPETRTTKALRSSVNTHFGVDINSNERTRSYVNARMTFAYFMHKKGYGLSRIGRMMGKDHSTILYYLKNIEDYLEIDADFRERFEIVHEDIYINDAAVHFLTEGELIKEVFSLRKEIILLHSQLSRFKAEERESKRLKPIMDMVAERTKKGTEDIVLNKLNKIYNGIV